ncbi:MAG: hypothetical protein IJU31_05175 [Synergistaceae bacterium]|nr:hypothetical protein [Synergistaceae bacterium]
MFEADKTKSLVWTIAGGYLLYLGDQLLTEWFHGSSDYPIASVVIGLLFVGVGGVLLFFAWKKWHADDENNQKENNEQNV